MSVNLHIATETADRVKPVVERAWFIVLAVLAGFLLGIAVMTVTSVAPPPERPGPFDFTVRP